MTTTEPSAFTALDDAFTALSSGPRPLAFDGRGVPGLPDRAIPFSELRDRLLHPSTPYATRDAVMAVLVTNAKEHGGAATIGLAGVLLPGLRRAAHPLVHACPERAADVEADMLAALLSAVAPLAAATSAGWPSRRCCDHRGTARRARRAFRAGSADSRVARLPTAPPLGPSRPRSCRRRPRRRRLGR